MRVLICGGRDYVDSKSFDNAIETWIDSADVVIPGAARGADTLASVWAHRHGKVELAFPADWATYGRSAGPRRNQLMLIKGKPDIVIAFPGGKGTANMVQQAEAAGVRTMRMLACDK